MAQNVARCFKLGICFARKVVPWDSVLKGSGGVLLRLEAGLIMRVFGALFQEHDRSPEAVAAYALAKACV